MEDIVEIKKTNKSTKKTTNPNAKTVDVKKPLTREEKQKRRDLMMKLASNELKSGSEEFTNRMQKYKRLTPKKSSTSAATDKNLPRWERARNARERREEKRAERAEEASALQSAAAEILLPESAGYIEAEEGERTDTITQQELAEAIDIQSARKTFNLELPTFGPYSIDYTRTGKHLLLAGRKGHVAVVEWKSKKLLTEFNVNQTIHDCTFLHNEGMFALAQKNWLHIYDSNGTELHCLRKYRMPLALEFLPYHFLLVSSVNIHYYYIIRIKNKWKYILYVLLYHVYVRTYVCVYSYLFMWVHYHFLSFYYCYTYFFTFKQK